MACDEAVYFATLLVTVEGCYRWLFPDIFSDIAVKQYEPAFYAAKGPVFVFFFVGSLCFTILFVLKLHESSIFKIFWLQAMLPYLYTVDSIGAIFLGYGLYYSHFATFVLGMVLLTNFFMINSLHRIFAKKKPDGMVSPVFINYYPFS
jgi:hypothetical protein